MSSSILHRCPFCGHVTDISESLAVFVENPHCNQCGLSASEGSLKLQDDLVALFNRQMNMETLSPEIKENSSLPPITYSITQHYHHSSHVAQQGPSSAFSAGNHTPGNLKQTSEILRGHKINPASLSNKQLELFQNAAPEQQSRLIQIWQICPEHIEGAERKNLPNNGMNLSQDLNMCDPAPGRNDNDGHQYAEPYMLSGYNIAATPPTMNEPTTGSPYRVSNDPVYQNQGQRWWERTQPGPMEY